MLCPVCGFEGLEDEPWADDAASDEICPSCGTHFGYDDAAGGDAGERQLIWAALRSDWKAGGCQWWSKTRTPPLGWDASSQLAPVDE